MISLRQYSIALSSIVFKSCNTTADKSSPTPDQSGEIVLVEYLLFHSTLCDVTLLFLFNKRGNCVSLGSLISNSQ